MRLIDLTRINQLIDSILDKINDKYATKAELNSGLKGKAEVNHGMHLTLGNTQDSAYRGDYGNAAYQHSQTAHAPSNAQKNSDITKAEIEAKLTGIITSHTHSDSSVSAPHNHTKLTDITSLTFGANSDDASIIKITTDSATSYTDFIMSDDIGSDMWRWRFKAWDPIAAENTDEYDLMTLKATSTTKGQLSINGNITADSFTEDGTALSSKYAAASHGTHVSYGGDGSATTVSRSDHTHSYLPLSGGTITGNIKFTDVTSTTYPAKSTMLTWNGSTDGADIYYQVDDSDKGRLVLNTRDDANCIIAFANEGTIISTIDNNGNFSGKATKADTLNTARTLTIGNTGKTFDGSANVSWSLSEIGAAAASSVGTLSSLQTSAKGNLVAAINELFQNANNGKQLIANAIGDSDLTSNSTFSAMSNAITDKRDRLYNLMVEGGYEVNSGMNLDSLLEVLESSGISVSDIKQIACGAYNTFILKKDGSLYACGANTSGQLGLGSTNDNATLTQVTTNINNDVKQVACGASHTVILKNDGSVWSCGIGDDGQLGLDVVNKTTFTKVTTNVNNDVKQVACGYYFTFILKNDGSVWACGDNYQGQLGLGNTNNETTFTKVTTNINNDVKQIVCGYFHTFIVKNDGSLWACGSGTYGQLGLDVLSNKTTFTKVTKNVNNDIKQVATGSYHTVILKNDGSLWSCGGNGNGQLGLGDTLSNGTSAFTQVTTNVNTDVKQIACGSYHTFILKNNGSLWSCGSGSYGQLGLGTTSSSKYIFNQVTKNVNNDVNQITCGYEHTFMLKNDGTVWSCGYNGNGQLGLSTSGTNAYASFNNIPRGF